MIAATTQFSKQARALAASFVIAGIAGSLAVLRLGSDGRQNLLLGGLIAIAVASLALAPRSRYTWALLFLAIAGAVAIGTAIATSPAPQVSSLSIVALILSVLFLPGSAVVSTVSGLISSIPIVPQSASLPATLVPSSAMVVTALLAATLAKRSAEASSAVALLAAAASVLVLAQGFDLGRTSAAHMRPAALGYCLAAITLLAASMSTDRIWLTSTVLLIGTSMSLEQWSNASFAPTQHTSSHYEIDRFFAAALAIGSSVAVVALSLDRNWPAVWPFLGALSVGLLGLALTIASSTRNEHTRLQLATAESRHDGLTGLVNRRGIDERLDAEIARAGRYDHPLSILLLDLDDFKQINDRLGHAAGDEALRNTAQIIQKSLRSIDIAARFGGEEFLVVLPETAADGALIVAERIRASMQEMSIATVSIGVAQLDRDESTPLDLIETADKALYTAKHSGKNRVALAP